MIDIKTQLSTEHRIIDNVETESSPDVLKRIHQTHTNITVYKREIEDLKSEVESVLDLNLKLRSVGSIDTIKKELKQTLNADDHNLIRQDIVNLLHCFAEVTNAPELRLFLATVDSNMCRKFHTDINTMRMLCTYSGPGTQWLSDETANAKSIQRQIDNDIEIEESLINQVDTGDVIILKGALYPDGAAVMHRSPIIEKTSSKRLLP